MLSRALAVHSARRVDREGVFIAALLEHRYRRQPLHESQRDCIGFDYAAVGAALAGHWQLPELIGEVLAHHIEPSQAKAWPAEVALVHLAWRLGESFALDQVQSQLPEVLPTWRQAAVPPAALETAVTQAAQDFKAALALLH
ncbi:MAG: HDOD domain-containing protein [Thiohalomonadaceae bacterium]